MSKRLKEFFVSAIAPSLLGAVLLSYCPQSTETVVPSLEKGSQEENSGDAQAQTQPSHVDCNAIKSIAENVVSKYAVKKQFPDHVAVYLKAHLCDALLVEEQYKIPAAGALAKAFAETSFDEENNDLIKKANNHFGAKKPDDGQYEEKYTGCIMKDTWEYVESNRMDQCFFVFEDATDSYLHFGERLTTRNGNLYAEVMKHLGNSREFLEALADSPYSTVPVKDEKKVTIGVLDRYNLDEIVANVKKEMKKKDKDNKTEEDTRKQNTPEEKEGYRFIEKLFQSDLFNLQLYSKGFLQGDLIVLKLKTNKKDTLEMQNLNVTYHVLREDKTKRVLSVPLVSSNNVLYGLLGTDFADPTQEIEVLVNLVFPSQTVSETYKFSTLPRKFEKEHLPASTKHGEAKKKNENTAVAREQRLLYPSWKPVTDDSYFMEGYNQPRLQCNKESFGSQRYIGNVQKSAHKGVDCEGKTGDPIYAASGGIVALVEQDFFYMGNTTVINHGLGLYTLYAHQTEQTAKAGAVVRKGEQIGTVGDTGRATGPHLHWQMKLQGLNIDPTSAEILNDIFQEQE